MRVILIILFSFFTMSFSSNGNEKQGKASYYHNKFNGRKTASGEIFSQKQFTAACNVYPLGTLLLVTNTKNGKSVVVKVNDRIGTKKRIIDLSLAAAKELGFVSNGITNVTISKIEL